MDETPEKSPSEPPNSPNFHERKEGADLARIVTIRPSDVAGSGALDQLIETARAYARAAVSENTLKAFAKDWSHFARWCRMCGVEPLPPSPEFIGPYIADLAAPQGRSPALSVASIERRLSGLGWGYAQRGWIARTATLPPFLPGSAANMSGRRCKRKQSCLKTCAPCWPPCRMIRAACGTAPSC